MAKISSSSSAFEKKGDPWVTDKEGRKNYGRILETENADRDSDAQKLSTAFWDRKIRDALNEDLGVKPYVNPPLKAVGDNAVRLANIRRKLRKQLDKKK